MRQTFSITFILKRRHQQQDKPQPISVRITVNGENTELTTQLKCSIKNWLPKFQQARGRSSEALTINSTINDIRARINYIFHQQVMHGESTSPSVIKDIFTDAARTRHHLLSFFHIHNENIRKQVGLGKSKSTYLKYEVTRRHLQGFIKANYSADDILISKINCQFIWEFEIYLKTVAKCSHNTTAKFIQFFKRIIRIALNNHYIKDDPFAEYQIKLHDVHRGFLTMDELKTIIDRSLDIPRLDLIRDLFVFSSFTGLAYSDIKKLEQKDLYSFNGQWWLRITRNKTNQMAQVMLFDIPQQLIAKHYDPERALVFPVPSNQKVNSYLKEIADLCGINKNLTFHLARHTCATLALSNGMPIESVSKLLGHKNVRTTQLYAKITDLKLTQDMEQLNNKISDRLNNRSTDIGNYKA